VENAKPASSAGVGVFAPLVSQASSRGAQLFGHARIIGPAEDDHEHFWQAGRGTRTRSNGRVPSPNRPQKRSA
jgi:hypothetical protein